MSLACGPAMGKDLCLLVSKLCVCCGVVPGCMLACCARACRVCVMASIISVLRVVVPPPQTPKQHRGDTWVDWVTQRARTHCHQHPETKGVGEVGVTDLHLGGTRMKEAKRYSPLRPFSNTILIFRHLAKPSYSSATSSTGSQSCVPPPVSLSPACLSTPLATPPATSQESSRRAYTSNQ